MDSGGADDDMDEGGAGKADWRRSLIESRDGGAYCDAAANRGY